MVLILQILLLAFALYFLFFLVKDIKESQLENESTIKAAIIGFITNFFDALGIGSFAPLTAMFRQFTNIKDRVLPGTLNVSCAIPVMFEAFLFISGIEVEPLTLISLIVAATVGSYAGAGFVSKMDEQKVRYVMGCALLITAVMMVLDSLGLMPTGGDATGIGGCKLILAIILNFIFGALMTAGIGLYAPCMAMVSLFGMSPRIAFPIMMGSCAFLMPVASVRFIKEKSYNRKLSLVVTISALFGIIIAVKLVKELPLEILKWLVVAVVLYTAITLLKDARSKK
ncbi:MAG: sulfite exporter TauE/SafE family protein [Tissierellia bacterium]|nr:sulfite exporter TauE/SafE family protein [Tissierellia bacterium]